MDSLCFLGTGLIGHALAEAAAGRGHPVSAWNRTAAKAADLVSHGVRVAASPAEAARGAARIHVAMTDDEGVDAVLAQVHPDPGAVVIDHTTASPARTLARVGRLAAQGVNYLHAPVFMSPAACRAAAGTMLVAGPRDRYEHVAAGLAAMTGQVWYVGERPDLAAVYKLLGNAMLIALCGGIADVFAIAHRAGLGAPEAMELFAHFDPAAGTRVRGARMAKDDFEPSFLLTTALKDLRLMTELAAGAPLAVLPGVGARMEAAIAAGDADLDYGVIGAPRHTGRG